MRRTVRCPQRVVCAHLETGIDPAAAMATICLNTSIKLVGVIDKKLIHTDGAGQIDTKLAQNYNGRCHNANLGTTI